MSVSIEYKKNFMLDFQNKIFLARNLLKDANHHWADKILGGLYLAIEKNEWLDVQRKHKLIMLISNSWWTYIQNLMHRKDLGLKEDYILYVDASKRFFSFLSKLNDLYLFNLYYEDFLRYILENEKTSESGISKFINSFSIIIKKNNQYLKLIELQVLLAFLTKSLSPTELFTQSMEELNKIIIKLEPSKRALFLYILLENVNLRYQLSHNSDFVKEVSGLLLNRIPNDLKNEFGNLKRITMNERSFASFIPDLEDLIRYLNNISEPTWIPAILKNLYNKIKEYQSFGEAITFLQRNIKFFIERNRYEIAFELYSFLEDIYIYQSDLTYDKGLIELWAEASKNFSKVKEKKYLLQALEKLGAHLKIPQTEQDLFHYFYTYNYIWGIKSMFSSVEEQEFWNIIFYRALFEEKNISISQKILPYLNPKIFTHLKDLSNLIVKADAYRAKIYAFQEEFEDTSLNDPNYIIKQIAIFLFSGKLIHCKMLSIENEIKEISITSEYWNDSQLRDIYDEIFFSNQKPRWDFSIEDLGILSYILLPKVLRRLLSQFEISILNFTPHILFITEEVAFPYELIYPNKFLMLNYSCTYYSDPTTLEAIDFESNLVKQKEQGKKSSELRVLLIESINSKGPLKWNEKENKKDLIYPFPGGEERSEFITNLFSSKEEINTIVALTKEHSNRNLILNSLKENNFNIIHIIGNLIYSMNNPQESFLITHDNNIIKLREIIENSVKSHSRTSLLIFFDIQVFDIDGRKIENPISTYSQIASLINLSHLTGVVFKVAINEHAVYDQVVSRFYENLIKGEQLGISMLNAQKQFLTPSIIKECEISIRDNRQGSLNPRSSQLSFKVPNYIIFGIPWRQID